MVYPAADPRPSQTPQSARRLKSLVAWFGRGDRPAILLLLTALLIGLLIVTDYGVSIDEPRNADVGRDALRAYSGGTEYFLHDTLAEHGSVYFMFFYATSKGLAQLFRGWSIPDGRHFTNFVTFLVGLYFFYLICLRLMRRLPALAATGLFATQPMLFGSAFINQKDIPFMVLFTGVIALGLAAGDRRAVQQRPTEHKGLTRELSDFGTRIGSEWKSLDRSRRRVLLIGTGMGLLVVLDLFFFGVLHRLGQSIVVSAYNGQAIGPIQSLFARIATDVYKTPLQLYLDRYEHAFSAMRILLTALVAATTVVAYTLTLPTLKGTTEGEWPRDRYPALVLGALLLGFAICVRQVGVFAGGLVSLYLL
jgi:hypothetical protein